MRDRRGSTWRLMLAAALCVAQARGDAKPSEYQVKAAFIYKFATYVRWPPATSAAPNTPFVIAVMGKDPFGVTLDAVVHGRSVQGRPVLIRRLGEPKEAPHCDLLFVSSAARADLQEILEALQGSPVLTVSDMDQFAELGGMINLVTNEENEIRFDINKEAIDAARLRAPSQILRLARIVKTRRTRG